MAWDDLTEEERGEFLELLRRAIKANRRWSLSPQMKRWKGMLAKVDPLPARPSPYPAPKPSAEPSLLYQKLKGGRRRR